MFPAELEQRRDSATAALAGPEEARASPQATRQDRKRIKELERDLLRKDRALAETGLTQTNEPPRIPGRFSQGHSWFQQRQVDPKPDLAPPQEPLDAEHARIPEES